MFVYSWFGHCWRKENNNVYPPHLFLMWYRYQPVMKVGNPFDFNNCSNGMNWNYLHWHLVYKAFTVLSLEFKRIWKSKPSTNLQIKKWILICPYETKQTMLICKEFIIKTVFIIGSKKKKSSKSFLKFVLI